MIYNVWYALEDYGALASFIDHHHMSHHITIDNSFTYDYAVRKCRYRAQKEQTLQSYSPLLDDFKDGITRTFIYSFEDCAYETSSRAFLKIFSKRIKWTARMTKVVLEIVFYR